MSTKSISKDSWTSVITTSADTVFQNTSDVNPMYLTTESTSGLNFDEGSQTDRTPGFQETTLFFLGLPLLQGLLLRLGL